MLHFRQYCLSSYRPDKLFDLFAIKSPNCLTILKCGRKVLVLAADPQYPILAFCRAHCFQAALLLFRFSPNKHFEFFVKFPQLDLELLLGRQCCCKSFVAYVSFLGFSPAYTMPFETVATFFHKMKNFSLFIHFLIKDLTGHL